MQLTTGTPDDARQMQSWAQPLGIEYLDGAIISYPVDIGKPQSIVLYSGPEDLFNRIKPLLLAFGDNAMFVGKEIGNASAQDMVILAFVMGTMFQLAPGIRRLRSGESARRRFHAVYQKPYAGPRGRSLRSHHNDSREGLRQYAGDPGRLGCMSQRAEEVVR